MKNLMHSKKFLFFSGISFLVLLTAVLLLTGVLKVKVTANKESDSTTTAPQEKSITTPPQVKQKNILAERPVTFKGDKEALKFSINIPLGWGTAENPKVEFITGSLTPETLPNGNEFTVNINAVIQKHTIPGTVFSDYATNWKDSLLKQFPSMEFVGDETTKINGMDVYVLRLKNTKADGFEMYQVQYIFYVDKDYALALTASTPFDSWSKYEQVITKSIESVKRVSDE